MLKALHRLLQERRANGETNQQIADSCGMSQQRINELLNGDASQLGKLRLEAALRLFPCLVDSAPPYISPRESRLLEAYRLASPTERQMMEAMAEAVLAAKNVQGSSAREAR